MKHHTWLAALALGTTCVATAPASALELDAFLAEINVAARADMGGFRAGLSATFGVSAGEVDELFGVFHEPCDVYMSLRLRDVARVPLTRVITTYHEHDGQGWGAIAKRLGIKPGSAEFHALKQGRLGASSGSRASHGSSTGKGQGKAAQAKTSH